MLENIREGLRSIKANLLRSVLTAVIVTFGITALVGSLTAVDGISYTLNESLSSLEPIPSTFTQSETEDPASRELRRRYLSHFS